MVGLKEQDSPVGVEAEAVSVTVPVNPFIPPDEIVEMAVDPALTVAGVTEPAVIVKSVT